MTDCPERLSPQGPQCELTTDHVGKHAIHVRDDEGTGYVVFWDADEGEAAHVEFIPNPIQ